MPWWRKAAAQISHLKRQATAASEKATLSGSTWSIGRWSHLGHRDFGYSRAPRY
ncbi:MAG: hypothetical protein QOK12_2304 [Mycobacterium sp.]|jgi:hypothetical protein|nr:hypothetical protein [Mycobacterium sp.]